MELLTPNIGLVFWTTVSFLIVLLVLRKFAWKPILKTVEEREKNIEESLETAKKTKEEMAKLTLQNEKILHQARVERDEILREARDLKDKTISEAKAVAKTEGQRIIENAKIQIDQERQSAIDSLKEEVSQLSIQIAEKLLRKDLSSNNEQKELVQKLLKDSKFNQN